MRECQSRQLRNRRCTYAFSQYALLQHDCVIDTKSHNSVAATAKHVSRSNFTEAPVVNLTLVRPWMRVFTQLQCRASEVRCGGPNLVRRTSMPHQSGPVVRTNLAADRYHMLMSIVHRLAQGTRPYKALCHMHDMQAPMSLTQGDVF